MGAQSLTTGLKSYILSFSKLSLIYYLSIPKQKQNKKPKRKQTKKTPKPVLGISIPTCNQNCKVISQGGKYCPSHKCTLTSKQIFLHVWSWSYSPVFHTWMFNILPFKSVCKVFKARDSMWRKFFISDSVIPDGIYEYLLHCFSLREWNLLFYNSWCIEHYYMSCNYKVNLGKSLNLL